jgi:hypothetical protein
MMMSMLKFVLQAEMTFLSLIPFVLAGLLVVLGILLRCKIARWFTLLIIYTFTLSPLVAYIMIGESSPIGFIVAYLSFLLISIYVLSNKKAMNIFYIEESNPSEHLSLILLALTINTVYIYLVRVV